MAYLGAIGADVSGLVSVLLDVPAANLVVMAVQVPPSPSAGAVDLGDRKSVRGTVLDENGDPLARIVLCIRQASREIVDSTSSDATTGAFELRPPDTGAVTIVAMPEPGDSRNAVVLYNLTPVDPL